MNIFEILFYAVLGIGILSLAWTFFAIPLDQNPDNKNTPTYTYDGDETIDNTDYEYIAKDVIQDNIVIVNDSGEVSATTAVASDTDNK